MVVVNFNSFLNILLGGENMKDVEKIKLKVNYGISDGEKTVKKSKTYSNIDIEAADDSLKSVGEAILGLVDGSNKTVYRVEEAELI